VAQALAPHAPVEAHLAGSAGAVPSAGADIHPVPAGPVLLALVEVVVLAGQGKRHPPPAPAPEHDHRPVLAAAGVLLEGHPRPHHLTGVGLPVRAGRITDLVYVGLLALRKPRGRAD